MSMILVRARLRVLLVLAVPILFGLVPSGSPVLAETVSVAYGTLSTQPGETAPIYDDELRLMIDLLIPEYHSMLLVFTECYGGDKLDNFADKPNCHAVSATSPGQTARYGGYHDNAAQALRPGDGRTSADVHTAGTKGKHKSETPSETGEPVSLGTPGSGNGAPESRHVLVYAGQPGGPEKYHDDKDRDAIVNNFAGQPNTTVTTVGGGTGYDFPATRAGMIDALALIGGQMNANEQFVLFVTDHGDLHHAEEDVNVDIENETSLTIDLPPELLTSMLDAPGNDELTGITCALSPFSEVEPVMVAGQVTVQVGHIIAPIVEFTPVLFDLNNNGLKDLEGEYWSMFFPIPEPSLVPWTPETFPTNAQGNVDFDITITNASPVFPMEFSRVTVDSGPISRGEIEDERPNTLTPASNSATLPTTSGGPIHGRDLKRLIEDNIPEYHSMLFVLTQCFAGDLMNDLDGFENTHITSATAPGQTATYGGYHDDAAGSLVAGEGRTSAAVHTAGDGGKRSPETPTQSGDPVSLAPTGSGGGAPASRHVLVYNGSPGGPEEYHDDNDRDQIEENFADDADTTVTTVGGAGTDDGYDYPATAEGLRQAMEAIGAQMNPNEQFIMFVGDHGDLHRVQESTGESSRFSVDPGFVVNLDFEISEETIAGLLENESNDDSCGVTLYFDYWDYFPGIFPDNTLRVMIDETTLVYHDYTEYVLDINDDGLATEDGEGYLVNFVIPEGELFPWTVESIPAVGGIVEYSVTVTNLSPVTANVSAATVDSGSVSKVTVAKQEVVKEEEYWGTLCTNSGPAIFDWELRYLMDKLIPNHHSSLVVLTQCYGGDCANNLSDRSNTGVISATSPGEKATYGGYDKHAADALKPGTGTTSDTVHTAGTAGKKSGETPSKGGSTVSLAPVDTANGPIKSRHVLYYAGKPGGTSPNSDNAYRDKIKDNFKDKPGTTVTTVGGSGSGAGYDHPGTWQGLTAAMNGISSQMNANEQFILFVSDHGDKHKVKKQYGKKKITPKKFKADNLKAYENYIKSLRKTASKADLDTAITILVDHTTYCPEFSDGDLAVSILGNPTQYSDFTYEIIDVDGDGVVDAEGDFHSFTFPVPEDEMYPWDDDSIPANVDGYVDYEVIVHNESDVTFAYEYIMLDSGPVAKLAPDVSETTLSVAQGPNPPADNILASFGEQGPVMQFTLSHDGSETIDVNSFTFETSGSATDPDDISAVDVYLDTDGDGNPDGDSISGAVAYATDDETLEVVLTTPLQLAPSTEVHVVVVVTTTPPIATACNHAPQGPQQQDAAGFPYSPLVAAMFIPLMFFAIRDRRFRGTLLVLIVTSFVCFPSCGGGGGSGPTLVPNELGHQGIAMHEASGFTLKVIEDSLVGNASVDGFDLSVEDTGSETIVEVSAKGADQLKALFFELGFDTTQYTYADSAVIDALGSGDSVLSMTQLSKTGEVHHGQVLANWPEEHGFDGDAALVRLRFTHEPTAGFRSVSTTAVSDYSQTSLFWDEGTGELTWRFFNQGDLNMDKLVYVSDLTQLGVHYNETGPFDVNSAMHAVDANRDGLIYLSDITPIGQNYDAVVEGYNVYTSDTGDDYPASNDGANGTGATLLGSVSFDDRTEITDERHAFSYTVSSPVPGAYYWVRPTDGTNEGTPSTIAGSEVGVTFQLSLTAIGATDSLSVDVDVEGLPIDGSLLTIM